MVLDVYVFLYEKLKDLFEPFIYAIVSLCSREM